ncbi:hypothetical protein Pmar_PMAR018479 [Perkinsus marinus ATCC 50983]|uniref:Uncharacterized protein n=1 Tax=Perkinsus marinus (strain ATCC 50983 / TXsc) TaxID=423536 RepID=C5KZX9_PERM5|nr:hypothetical protein Pmar_PMAR018479 [Perkinsus marinus ATCC 50983]EER09837.1 hypothetical protein Pmar_PMAR018479 [Perkinsus marinus ATCC 50983]|eukprot:XP_002778042.1 hypothetical protein Pmar_PMAR018479 [Perkinsus marinus ATCC 50983]
MSALAAIKDQAARLAPMLVDNPVEVWRLWKIFEKGFKTVPEDSPVLPRLAELMHAIGTAMRAVDPQLTASAAKDGFVGATAGDVLEMLHALREEIVYCYGGRMGEVLPPLVRCMNFIITLRLVADYEDPAGRALADVYIYYALQGVDSSSYQARTRGLGILLELAASSCVLTEVIREATVKTVIAATVEEVESGTRLGWEQQAVVLALLLTFLDVAVRGSSEGVSADAEDDIQTREALELLVKLLSGTASVEVRQIALVALAKSRTLEAFEELLMEPFLEAVIDSPDETRRSVLSPSFDGHTTTLPVDASPCLRCWWKRQIEETPREFPQRRELAELSTSHCLGALSYGITQRGRYAYRLVVFTSVGGGSIGIGFRPSESQVLDSFLSVGEEAVDSAAAHTWIKLFRSLSGPLFASLLIPHLHDLAAMCIGHLLAKGVPKAVSLEELSTLIWRKILMPYYREGAAQADAVREDRLVEFIRNFEPENAASMAIDQFREKLNAV